MRTHALTAITLVFLGSACAGETQERPAPTRAPEHATRPTLPFPEDAFQGDATSSRTCDACEGPSTTSTSRFETRRIGDAPASGRRWHGAPVDLDLKDADLHNVFRLLADVGKTNIVVAGEIGGTITLKLKRVPWDQALDVVVRAKGLYVERDGNVLMVTAHAPPPEATK